MGPSGGGLVGAQGWWGGWGPGAVGTYELFCSKRNATSVVVTCEVVGTLNHYKMVKNLNFVH